MIQYIDLGLTTKEVAVAETLEESRNKQSITI